mmetsp:Transcript_42165/g.122331  ORF Transcript_42165/g.122331 Transcript_42165/m.122331 type:complete len:303 (+) Transcript_42165:329-1237(+)
MSAGVLPETRSAHALLRSSPVRRRLGHLGLLQRGAAVRPQLLRGRRKAGAVAWRDGHGRRSHGCRPSPRRMPGPMRPHLRLRGRRLRPGGRAVLRQAGYPLKQVPARRELPDRRVASQAVGQVRSDGRPTHFAVRQPFRPGHRSGGPRHVLVGQVRGVEYPGTLRRHGAFSGAGLYGGHRRRRPAHRGQPLGPAVRQREPLERVRALPCELEREGDLRRQEQDQRQRQRARAQGDLRRLGPERVAQGRPPHHRWRVRQDALLCVQVRRGAPEYLHLARARQLQRGHRGRESAGLARRVLWQF